VGGARRSRSSIELIWKKINWKEKGFTSQRSVAKATRQHLAESLAARLFVFIGLLTVFRDFDGETACPTYFAKRLIQQGGAGGFACRSNGKNQWSASKMNASFQQHCFGVRRG